MKYTCCFLILVTLISCLESEDNASITIIDHTIFTENFNNQIHIDEFWEDTSQNESPMNYAINNGNFKITTRANEVDRVKIKTKKEDFGLGRYTWRIYTSERTIGDRNSIGAFLYSDDDHELDFEIGSGKTEVRNTLNAEEDDLVVYCTSQNFPFISTPFLIKHNQWHTFSIELLQEETDSNYTVKWYVDGALLQTQVLDYSTETVFSVYCSLENLNFIGDQLPSQEYSVLFDSFKLEE
ncbi:hypothetical protein [Lacinutrix sp.]|uniref:hypothetical protein n=1 Tax=Lacinutrix sp. TaxID=1937692 RepID=UPI0025C2D1A3|nr:hypothetical protein [Lacinutrix sp.]